MKLHVLDRSTSQNKSFSVSFNSYPNFLKIWHAHSEFELAVILESYGSCFVGDSITPFVPGTVVLIGKNLPHMWLNDDVFFQSDVNLKAEAIAVHFKEHFLGKEFWQLPEMTQIGALLTRSQQGILFRNLDGEFMQKVKLLLEKKGIERVMLFLALLDKLSHHSDFKLLASKSYQGKESQSNSKFYSVYEYIFEHFNEPIRLKDVATLVNMNPSSFSRLFTKLNRKSFSRYLNEIRIGYACKLLIEKQHSITSICYQCGFNNISNFNRQFKLIKQMSPSEYLKHYRE